eukprot:gene13460-9633_t
MEYIEVSAKTGHNSRSLLVDTPMLYQQRDGKLHVHWNALNFDFARESYKCFIFQVEFRWCGSFSFFWSDWARATSSSDYRQRSILIEGKPQYKLFQVRVRAAMKRAAEVFAAWGEWSTSSAVDLQVGSVVTSKAAAATTRKEATKSAHADRRDFWSDNTSRCEGCGIEFSFLNRRHHCREPVCGKCLCLKCCPAECVGLVACYGAKLVRICRECHGKRERNRAIEGAVMAACEPDFMRSGLQCLQSIPGLVLDLDEPSSNTWGHGGTSVVYKGHWCDRRVAVKLYKQAFLSLRSAATDLQAVNVDKLKMEATVYAECAGYRYCVQAVPDLIRLDTKHPFLATELHLEHGTLLAVLENKAITLSWRWKVRVLQQIARFVQHLHSRKIAHVDLRAENCVVTSIDEDAVDRDDVLVKVFDFNSSSYFGPVTAYQVDRMTRTPSHTPPEFLRVVESITNGSIVIDSSVVRVTMDGKYDVFSLGIVMAEVASRELRYRNDLILTTPGQVEQATLDGERPVLTGDRNGLESLPLGFHHVAERCWQANPVDRPSLEVIVQMLSDVLGVLNGTAPPPSWMAQSLSTYEKSQRFTGGAGPIEPTFLLVWQPPPQQSSSSLTPTSSPVDMERLVPGLRVMESLEEAAARYRVKAGAMRPMTVYRRHPVDPLYIAADDYIAVLWEEKVNEMNRILADLGAKEIVQQDETKTDNSFKAHASVAVPTAGGVTIDGGRADKASAVSSTRLVFGDRASQAPTFRDSASFVFYPSEPSWQSVKEEVLRTLRVSPHGCISVQLKGKSVSVTVDTEQLLEAKSVLKILDLAQIGGGFERFQKQSLTKAYEVEFYSQRDYEELHRQIVSRWSAHEVADLLRFKDLGQYCAVFVEHGFSGELLVLESAEKLVYSVMGKLTADVVLVQLHCAKLLAEVKAFVEGKSCF